MSILRNRERGEVQSINQFISRLCKRLSKTMKWWWPSTATGHTGTSFFPLPALTMQHQRVTEELPTSTHSSSTSRSSSARLCSKFCSAVNNNPPSINTYYKITDNLAEEWRNGCVNFSSKMRAKRTRRLRVRQQKEKAQQLNIRPSWM